jgi:hypothetical protein
MAGITWSDNEIQLLKEKINLGTLNFKEMSAFFPGRTPDSLQLKARERKFNSNYRFHKWTYNKDFFHTPNYINCFYAGWLAADGNLSKITESKSQYCHLRWACHSTDLPMVELFKKSIEYTGNIRVWTKDKTNNKYQTNCGEHCVICLNGIEQMENDLKINFGITPNKTYHLPPPILDKLELKLAYIVGYINGDGCIHSNERNLSIGFTSSSINILNWLKNLIDSFDLPMNRAGRSTNINKMGHANCYGLVYNGTRAIYLYWLLKRVPVPILERKWNNPKIESFISKQVTKNPDWFSTKVEDIEKSLNILY